MDLRKMRLEDAINHFFSLDGGLDQPQAARSDRLADRNLSSITIRTSSSPAKVILGA